ncbi:MAG: hypothetical protein ACK5H1_08935 [Tenacibaculum sp.]
MSLVVKIIFIIVLLFIFFQDIKETKVVLGLFLLGSILGTYIFYKQYFTAVFLINIAVNCAVVIFIGLLVFIYAKIKLKKEMWEAIGAGDFLFFFLMALIFPTVKFLTLFTSSLFFSLILSLLLKSKLKHRTVPLAGFQALFLSLILTVNLLFSIINLYAV